MDLKDLEKKVEEMEKRALELKKAEEERAKANEEAEKRDTNFYKENFKNMTEEVRNNIAKAFVENRNDEGLKINATGKDYYGDLVEKFRIEKPLTQRASFLRGAYTGFQIPLITARPAVNASATEGDIALSVDSQMALGRKTITPSLFYAILGITYQTEKFSQVTDAEIEDAFAESFGEKIENDLQSRNAGSAYPICGLLSKDVSVCVADNKIEAASAGVVGWKDLYDLVDKVKGKVGKWTIVVPSNIISGLLATTTEDYNFCKEEYLRKGTIRGVEVVEIATAVSHTAGDVYATIIDLNKNLKVCLAADDVILRTVYDKNSLNKYLQGACGIAAAVVLPNEVYQLVAKQG